MIGVFGFAPFVLLIASASAGGPLPYDHIGSIPQNVGIDTLIARFLPALEVPAVACVPYPAVDEQGNWSQGLRPIKDRNSGCTPSAENKGQTYARMDVWGGYSVIMYTWYLPKTQPGSSDNAFRHAHAWMTMIVVVNPLKPISPITTSSINFIWTPGSKVTSNFVHVGPMPIVMKYFAHDGGPEEIGTEGANPFHNHQYPVVDFHQLSPEVQQALYLGDHWQGIKFPLTSPKYDQIVELALPSWLLALRPAK